MAEFVMQALAKQSDVDDKVNASRTVGNNTSVNSVVISGFYRLSGSTPDMPSGCAYGQLIVSRGNDTVSQIAMPYGSSTMYIRGGSYYNNQWSFSAWEKVALNSKIANIEVPISGSYANQSAFETAMNSIISSMSVGEQKFVNVAFETAWEPFGGSRFFGVLARETSNRWVGMFYSYSGDIVLMTNNVGTIAYKKVAFAS